MIIFVMQEPTAVEDEVTLSDRDDNTEQTASLQRIIQLQSQRIEQMAKQLEHLTKTVQEGFTNLTGLTNQKSNTSDHVSPTAAASLDICPWGEASQGRTFVVRLLPNMPLKQSIIEFCRRHHLNSASISTCVGSLTKASLRMACGVKVTS